MKQIIIRFLIIFCLLGPVSVVCLGSTSYTVQVLASKTPEDIQGFSLRYHIESKIYVFKDDGWYKYVVGQFKDRQEASRYIAHNLVPKGLQGPFPRILSDSLKTVILHESKADSLVSAAPTIQAVKVDSLPAVIESKNKAESPNPVIPSNKNTKSSDQKHSTWSLIIGFDQLQKMEIAVVKGVKLILPKAWIPFYDRMIDKAIRFPVLLFFLMLIIGFIVNAILIIIFLEISNTFKNKFDRYEQLYTLMYERALTGYIFQEYELEDVVKRIKKIRIHRNRKIFIAVLFNFKKNLSGDLNEKLMDVFIKLGLEKDSIEKTKRNSFYQRILGIRELTNLYPSAALPIVEAHINDKNDELRAEAQTSYVRLNHEEPFGFLRSLRKPFTQWTQLTSFYIFRLHKLPAPSFVEYLKSDLHNVQNFSLRMIIFFQQLENADEITKLLYSKRERTRFLAIRAVNELGIHEAKALLKEIYHKETYKNRLEIIKGFLLIGDDSDFNFLENIIRGNDITLKIEACRSMYFMNAAGKETLLRLKEQEQELNLDPFIAHIYDLRN